MKTRQKDNDFVLSDSGHFKQLIKASQSEIMKDILSISDSPTVYKQVAQIDPDPRKLSKVWFKQRPRKSKTKITDDISPVLGLASLLNEVDSSQPILQKKPKPVKIQNIRKKEPKVLKCRQFMKMIGYTRAETHLGIACYVKQKLKRN